MRAYPDPRILGRRSAGIRASGDRIQARAVARVQELLIEYPEGGGRPPENLAGTGEVISRRKAAHDAGLSDRQYRTAMDVGRIPKDQFESLVESDNPPTVTALAAIGRATQSRCSPTTWAVGAIRGADQIVWFRRSAQRTRSRPGPMPAQTIRSARLT